MSDDDPLGVGDPNAGVGDPNAGVGDPNAGVGTDPYAVGGSDPSAGVGTDPDAVGGGDPDAGVGTDPSAGAGGDPSTGVGGDPDAGAGGDPSTGGGGDPDAGVGTDPDAGAGGHPSTGGGGDPDAGVGGDPDAGVGGDPSAGAGGDPSAGAGGDPSTGGGGDPDAGVGSDPSAGVGGDPSTGGGGDPSTGAGGAPDAGVGGDPSTGGGGDPDAGVGGAPDAGVGSDPSAGAGGAPDAGDGQSSDGGVLPFDLSQGFSPGDQPVTDGPIAIGEPLSDDAPATTTASDAGGWWGLESDLSAASWKDADSPHLESLERVPSMHDSLEIPPWRPGYELDIRAFGGLVSNDRRRYTLVGHDGSYVNQVRGNRTITADYHSTRVRRHRTDTVARTKDSDGLDASWGRDRLTVERDASHEFHSRTLMMSGLVKRNWNGGIMRLAAMEGVVCGGAMIRVIAGPAATMSQMMTGDVYGGIARASAVRAYLAVLQYRAAKDAAWAMGLWVRRTTFTIVPAVPTPPAVTPAGNALTKMARLNKMATKAWRVTKGIVAAAGMVCPLVDILVGVLTIPFALVGLATLFAGFVSKKTPVPPAGPPRVVQSNSGVTAETYMSKTIT